MLLRTWVPSAAHFSFAFTPNRSATMLQLTFASVIHQMTNWEGSACLAKVDIQAAFDYVSW
eukprot:1971766-Amphidinium_carterae.1